MKTLFHICILLAIYINTDLALAQTASIQIIDETYNQNQMIVQINCFDCNLNDTIELNFSLENQGTTTAYSYSNTFIYVGNYNLGDDTLTFFHPTYMHDLNIVGGEHFKVNQSWKFQYYLSDYNIRLLELPYFQNTTSPNGYYFNTPTNNWLYGGTYGPYTLFSIYHNMDSIFLNADYIGAEVDFMRYLPYGNCDSNAISVNHTDTSNYYTPDYEEQYMYYVPEDSITHIKKLIDPENFGSIHFGLTYNCNTYFDNIKLYPVFNTYICEGDSIEINGIFRQDEGVYIDSLYTVLGTDSIIGINLKYQNLIYGDTVFATICENETYYLNDTLSISNAGTFTFLTSTPQSCDSIFYLDLTVQENAIPTNITSINHVLSYTNPQSEYTYQWINTNTNQPIAGETSDTFTPSVNGSYAVEVYDGICTQLSNTFNTNLSIKDWEYEISIFPNPFSSHISITFKELKPKVSVYITDIQSKLVFKNTYKNVIDIQLNGGILENGIYQITINDGIYSTTKQIIRLE